MVGRMCFRLICLLAALVASSLQSDCVVSSWGDWSSCYGGCSQGLIVRNRDVVQPPLPEYTSAGRRIQKLCPHLYETKFCDPQNCEVSLETRPSVDPLKRDDPITLVEEQMKKFGFEYDNNPMDFKLRQKFIKDTEQLIKLDNHLTGAQQDQNVSTIDISTSHITNDEFRKQGTSVASKLVTPPVRDQSTRDGHQMPVQARPDALIDSEMTSTTTTTAMPVNVLIKKIEKALSSNGPDDEKTIRKLLRRNHKFSKMLFETYQNVQMKQRSNHTHQRTTPSTTTTTTTASTTTTTTTSEPTTQKLPYWPKTGYIPNSRQHASEITSKLYMTNEIVQAVDNESVEVNAECPINKRCCRISRDTCEDGSEPKMVKRWYRPEGSSKCVLYHYPKCTSSQEMEEQPIRFEQNCQDVCFAKTEKKINPLFNLESDDDQ